MSCRPIIQCLLNCIIETTQVTEGRMLASPGIWITHHIKQVQYVIPQEDHIFLTQLSP
jgi:hypothetical protein